MFGHVIAGRVSTGCPLGYGVLLQPRSPPRSCLLPASPAPKLTRYNALSAFSGKTSPLQRNRYWSRFSSGEDSEERPQQIIESETAAVGRWGETVGTDTLQQTALDHEQHIGQNAAGKAGGASVTVTAPNMLRKGAASFTAEQAMLTMSSGDFNGSSLSSISVVSSVDDYGKQLDFTDLAEEEAREAARSKDPAAQSPYGKANYEVLRLEASGRYRGFYVRRRDVLREHKLQPRDLRRIDPSVDFTKTSPSITIKENVLMLNLGGVRAIVTAEKALLFEPNSAATRKFLEVVLPRIRNNTPASAARAGESPSAFVNASHADYMARYYKKDESHAHMPPFELEVLEAALTVATGRIDAELSAVQSRMDMLFAKLPGDVSPLNLEELRKAKQALVELENKADTLRGMLEEAMDDEDELRELNLSSRPRREERRRTRERNRLERELERAREIREELEERVMDDGQPITASLPSTTPVLPPLVPMSPMSPQSGLGMGLGPAPTSVPIVSPSIQRQGGQGLGGTGSTLYPFQGLGHVPGSSGNGSSSSSIGSGLHGHSNHSHISSDGNGAAADGSSGLPLLGGFPMTVIQPAPGTPRSIYVPGSQQQGPSYGSGGSYTGSMGMGNGMPMHGGIAGVPPMMSPGANQPHAGVFNYTSMQAMPGQTQAPMQPVLNIPMVLPDAGMSQRSPRAERAAELRKRFDRERLAELRAKFGWVRERDRDKDKAERDERERERERDRDRDRDRRKDLLDEADWMSRLGDSEEDLQEAMDALEEMVEEEEQEAELEEVEDLLEYYLQRASAVQSEAEQMLAGARDLEESIGVSLSARRYEVNRLELLLSIGSFAAAVGAMFAGIFGMNMRSNLEASALSFWGVSGAIVLGCAYIFFAVMRYTRNKKIL